MGKASLFYINLIIILLCAIFAIVLQAVGITAMASMFIMAMCFFIAITFLPMSISRVHKDKPMTYNLLIVLSTNLSTMLLIFLIVTFGYLGLFRATMFGFFEVVFYPTTLAVLLLEYIIANTNKNRYINNINDIIKDDIDE